MQHPPLRRALLLAAVSMSLIGAGTSSSARARRPATARDRLSALEAASGGRLGVAALNTADGARLDHRAGERFAFCSTFKVLAASAILKRAAGDGSLLQQRVTYEKKDLVTYSPMTEKHVGQGMTVAELCAAALQYSDNTAANLLVKMLGGPGAVTAFARSIHDDTFRLDRWETELNTAIPGDPRDTSTPEAMMTSLQRLTLGDALGAPQRDQLVQWMLGNTTGATRIRAGVPAAWTVADKTGAGSYGTTNDIGVLWPPGGPPVVLAVYFTQTDKEAPARNDVVASAARVVAETFAR